MEDTRSITVVEGIIGAGKTTLISVIKRIIETEGDDVHLYKEASHS